VTAEQISLRDPAYYQENMIEFMFEKEVTFIITIKLRLHNYLLFTPEP